MKSDKIATPEQPMPVFRFYLNAMVVFFVLRLLFLFYHLSLFENSSMTDIVWAFLCGFMIDSSVTTTVLFFLSLFAIPIEFISRKAATKFYICSVHVCLGFCFFVNLADIAYFEIYDSRLNILVWENIGQMGPILQTILVEFHLYVALLALAGLMAGFAWLNRHTVRFFRCRWCQKHRAISTACSLVALVGLSFLWIGEPFWRMSAFASGNQALNQLSLNGVYTLTKALDQKRILDNDSGGVNYQFGSLDSALDRTRATIVSDSEEAVSDLYPLARKQISPVALSVAKPNIVIIIMERLTANNVGVLNAGDRGRSPGFDELAADGILFTNFYGHETRTHHGLVSTVGSFPSVLGSYITRRRGTESFYTLGTLLSRYGYETSFIYGYDQGFDHMGYFLKQGGFDRIIDKKSFHNPRFTGKWGVSDEDLFDRAHEIFSRADPETPFLSVLLTSSNHSPFDIPQYFIDEHPQDAEDLSLAAFAYADYALKLFMDKASKEPYFERTIFVIVADHGEVGDPDDRYLKRFHTPCLIYAPHLVRPARRVSTIGAQIDIAPTLMHLIGYPDPYHFFGRNLLELSEDDGFAVMRSNFTLYYRKGDRVLVRDIRDSVTAVHEVDSLSRMMPTALTDEDEVRAELNQALEDYLQSLHYIFSNGKHRVIEHDPE